MSCEVAVSPDDIESRTEAGIEMIDATIVELPPEESSSNEHLETMENERSNISCPVAKQTEETCLKNQIGKQSDSSKTKPSCCCSCHSPLSGDATERTCPGVRTQTNIDLESHPRSNFPLRIDCIQGIAKSNTDSPTSQTSPTEPVSPVRSTTSEKICRICLDAVEEERLIAPCHCSGSTKYAHETCLLQWFFRSRKKSCELCLAKVNVKPVGFKPVHEWRLPQKKCDFIVYLFGLYFLIMLIFTGMITWIATQGCTSPVCITLYAVCGVALIYFVYCCGCVEYSRSYWKALVSVNRIWRIYGREDSNKNINKIHLTSTMSNESSLPGSLSIRLQNSNCIMNFTESNNKHSREDMKKHVTNLNQSNDVALCQMHVTGTDNPAIEYDEQHVTISVQDINPVFDSDSRQIDVGCPRHNNTNTSSETLKMTNDEKSGQKLNNDNNTVPKQCSEVSCIDRKNSTDRQSMLIQKMDEYSESSATKSISKEENDILCKQTKQREDIEKSSPTKVEAQVSIRFYTGAENDSDCSTKL